MASAAVNLSRSKSSRGFGPGLRRRLTARLISERGGLGWRFWMCLWLGAGLGTALGQAPRASNWRVYRSADGLTESLTSAITISPNRHVWVKHGEVDAISMLDGYTISHIPAPDERNYRVYQSQAGKIWSVYAQGVMEYLNDQWVRYPVEDVRLEHEANPMRAVRQTPLLPAEEDRVLILLPDRLIEFRALRGGVKVLRRVQDTHLGKFIDIAQAFDGGAWITGADGLVKLPPPLRRFDANTVWKEFPLPSSLQVRNLQRPFEDDDGGVTTVGDYLPSDRRVLVHFDGTDWITRMLPGENLRFAWRGQEPDTFWGLTLSSLVRLYSDHSEVVREGLVSSQAGDVAVQRGGVFWLATLEGLMRYAPLAWRSPSGNKPPTMLIHAALAQDTNLWFAGSTALIGLRDGVWRYLPWPAGLELTFRAKDGLFSLPDGRLAIEASDQVLLFDPARSEFTPLRHPLGRRVRRILRQLPDHKLCLQTEDALEGGKAYQFELYDGHSFKPYPDAPPPIDLGQELFFLAQAKNGDFWLGGSAGPAVWRDKKWQRFGTAEGYSDEGALSWLEWDEARIWCAGLGRIAEFDGKTWTTVRTGFDRVSAMVRAADGSVWVASNDGLYRYYQEAWGGVGEEEGLPSRAVYCLAEDPHRQLWVGTSRGVSQYFPLADIDAPKTFTLRADTHGADAVQGTVSVQFQAVDKWQYTPPDRLSYSYRVDEGRWSPFLSATGARLRDLSAGPHRLEVRSMDRNWNIEIKAAQLEFAVTVPWYRERRIVAVAAVGLGAALFFAGLAINRHLQLRRSYAQVEKTVAERTRELQLATQELAHSQKMTALGTLAAGIAHDFNNILSIIRGSAQIIETHLEDREKVLARVSRIKTMVDQGAEIVKAMLGFGRVSDKQLVACDLNGMVDDTIRLLGDRFLKEVKIRRALAPGLPPTRAVKDLVQQMLLNLIFNAADAMSGSGDMEVRTGRLAALPPHAVLAPVPASHYLFVTVQDMGCGMPPEVLPRIFEPFFTTKAFSSRRGTGLGLYMVYEFAKEMGHGLVVESRLNEGTAFTIIMPVAEVAPEA